MCLNLCTLSSGLLNENMSAEEQSRIKVNICYRLCTLVILLFIC